ncbi:MAG: DNRLRE domain-containing protein [Calditrichaeota bacterium]|nr:MAG: DNRLRE domain-containing protein [Calditrichota bacterium]
MTKRCHLLRQGAIVGLLLLMGLGCGSDAPIQGFDFVDPNARGSIDSTVVSDLAVEATFSDTITATGRSSNLLVGSLGGVATQTLLRFEDVPDTVVILNAALLLRTKGILSDGKSKSTFEATVHPVTADWDETTVTAETFQDAFDPVPIASAEILPVGSGVVGFDSTITEIVRFEFDQTGVELVRQWADSTKGPNNGILIDGGSNSTFIKEFFSSVSPTNLAVLELDVLNGTERDTLSINVSQDTYLARQVAEPPPGPLYIDNVFSQQTVLKFDLSAIPRESTINRISMKLNLVRENSILADEDFRVFMQVLFKPFEPPKRFRVDSTVTSVVFSFDASGQMLITPNSLFRLQSIFQRWINEDIENNGFILRTLTPGRDVARVALHSTQTDPELAPRVEIDFSTAPTN